MSGVCEFVCVCMCVRTLKGKWLELSTPNLVHIYFGLTFVDPKVKCQGHMITQTIALAWVLLCTLYDCLGF